MKSIVTITFNPAIDKSISIERLVAEHKMNTSEPVYHAGGGGVNIIRALKKLGFPGTAIYFKGGNTGRFFSDLLTAEKVNAISVNISGATRENFIVNEQRTGKQFRFGLPGPFISQAELDVLLDKLTAIDRVDFLIVSGSLAPGIPLDVFKRLKEIVVAKNARMVVDTSGKALKSALEAGVFLIKPSLAEMAGLVGKKRLNASQAITAARQIISSGKCEVIVISMGSHGAILVTDYEDTYIPAPAVNVVSTVGAGDSMLAGILLSLAKKKDLKTALQYGIACGSAATLHAGTDLCDKNSVDKMLVLIQNGK